MIFGGRLGEYKYYDMDQVIAAVLEKCEKEFVGENILTFHSANNFGALLQAVSLQKTIIEHGGTECELINYEPEFIYKDYSISPFKSKHPKVIIKSILRIPDKIKRNSKFQSFREENTICSGQCQSEDSFEKTCNSFEKIIVGSDQVWNYNLTEHDMHYFLSEIDDSVEKIAYAASTGGADFSTDESNEMIQCLQRFKNISVRESASKETLNQRLKEKNIEIVLDPVFLTTQSNWLRLAAKPVKKDYILFFKMGYSKTAEPALEFAKKLSEETGYELLMLWDQETWFKYRDVKHIGAAGPAEFLQWIAGAKCVVTNSFHATAFSIILNTPFYVETEIERKDRVLNILNIFKLEKCGLVKGKSANGLNIPKIEWNVVNLLLDNERHRSLDYIDRILK